MSLRTLKQLRQDIQTVIDEIESLSVPRDIDIGVDFSGKNELIAEIIRKSPTKKTSIWYQTQTIYCSTDKCESCPHGPFIYKYRRNKQGQITVKYVGEPVFDTISLANRSQRIRKNPPPKQGILIRQDNSKNRG